MSDELLFEDSPIAKYMASVAARPRKGAKKTAIKIETIKEPVHIEEQIEVPSPAPLLPPSSSHTNAKWKTWIIGSSNEVNSAKHSALWRLSAPLIRAFSSLSNPSFSGILASSNTDYEVPSAPLVHRLHLKVRFILILAILLATCPAFWSWTFAFTTALITWPFLCYAASLIIRELWYFRTIDFMQGKAEQLALDSSILLAHLKSAIQLIQEVELVSRGYRITSQLSPIARLEQNAKTRRCQVLRSATRRSLLALRQAFLSPRGLDSSIFEGIYSTNNEDAQDDAHNATSITVLKSSFQNLQLAFDRYLGSILISTFTWHLYQGELGDFRHGTWRIAQSPTLASILNTSFCLTVLADCIKTQALSMKEALSYQDSWVEKSPPASKTTQPETKSSTKTVLLEHLNTLQASLQTSLARTMLCKDHLQQIDGEEDVVLNEILQVFAKMQEDLSHQPELVSSVSNSLNRWTRELQSKSSSVDTSQPATTTAATQNHGEFSTATTDELDPSSSSAPSTTGNRGGLEKVYEAETGNEEEEVIVPSKLSREERIAIARKEREEARQRESEMFAKLNFVMELKDVLHSRAKDAIAPAPESTGTN